MGAMNKNMNLPKLQQIMRDFERQNERMEMSSEMMGDAIDDAFEVCTVAEPPFYLRNTSHPPPYNTAWVG